MIYTKEILRNICGSLPLFQMILGIITLTGIIVFLGRKFLFTTLPMPSTGKKLFHCGIYLIISILSFVNIDISAGSVGNNKYNTELSKEGTYSLFNSFRSNKLGFADLYNNLPPQTALEIVQKDLKTENMAFLSPHKNLKRQIISKNLENRNNVILVILQDISAEEINTQTQSILPNLNALSQQSLSFANAYAAGNNHLLGIKALILSLPPLPSAPFEAYQDYQNIYGLGTIFKNKGYDNKWIYGSYGSFNNLNNFFSAGGFEVIDRPNWENGDTTFANILGASDEDLFNKILREANKSYNEEKPFLTVSMTMFPHYFNTFPHQKIPSLSFAANRINNLKYTDYAIGKFIKKAQKEPWFDKTVFIFTSAQGELKSEDEISNAQNYHIPLFIYAPKIFSPSVVSKNISQIDLAPTLLSLLKFNYDSNFFGKDVLEKSYIPRYFSLINQKLIYFKNNIAIILNPAKNYDYIGSTQNSQKTFQEAVAYYQTAADRYNNLQKKE